MTGPWTRQKVTSSMNAGTRGILAYDLAEAIAKTADETGFDLGDTAIEAAMVDFLVNALNHQAALDNAKEENTNG